MEGFGVITYKDGRKYEGFFESDKKQGFGKYTFVDQSVYSGFWNQNK